MSAASRMEAWLQPAILVGLLLGCWLVLQPFVTAILFAVVIAVSTWPAYLWLRRRLGGRRIPASLLACLLVIAAMMGPAALLTVSLMDALAWLSATLQDSLANGAGPAPAWLSRLPVVGDDAVAYWNSMFTSDGQLLELVKQVVVPMRSVALSTGRALGGGVLQIIIAVFLLFFLYRDGEYLGAAFTRVVTRVGGLNSQRLLNTAQQTVVGVMLGAIGTALAQSMVAMLGYSIAGVPAAFLLGAATFVLSLVPVGPPIIWIGASVWLFRNSEPGWAIFMLIYGFFVISSIDNLIKPLVISRTSRLPFVLTFLGVTGGVIAFGFMGVFLGPTLLAVVSSLGRTWLEQINPPDSAPAVH